jgi:hypothetical protein
MDPPASPEPVPPDIGTSSIFRGLNVSDIVNDQVDRLGLGRPSAPDPSPFLTRASLSVTLDARDATLKHELMGFITAEVGKVLDALRPPPPAASGRGTDSFDHVSNSAFRSAAPQGPAVNDGVFRGQTVRLGNVPPPPGSPERSAFSDHGDGTTRNPYQQRVHALSPLRDSKRGENNSLYLCGVHGVKNDDPQELMVGDFLAFLGFPFDLHQAIVDNFRDLVEEWSRPEVNPKYVLTSFRPLPEDFNAESFLDWYTHFCFDLKRFFICLVPFDAIVLRWSYVGLCLPGVGETRYMAMGQALFLFLTGCCLEIMWS